MIQHPFNRDHSYHRRYAAISPGMPVFQRKQRLLLHSCFLSGGSGNDGPIAILIKPLSHAMAAFN